MDPFRLVAQLVDDGAVQDAVRERILAGDAVAFFRAIDHVLGKPKETIEANVTLGTLSERIKRTRERAWAVDWAASNDSRSRVSASSSAAQPLAALR
jgi:hypothetical protein